MKAALEAGTAASALPVDLVDHLSRTSRLSAPEAAKLVAEVSAYFSETVEAFVRRRHRELQAAGLTNASILPRIAAELRHRPVAAPRLSQRQLRRIVYG